MAPHALCKVGTTNFHHSLGGNSNGCWLSIANSLQIFQAPAESVHMDYLLV